MLGEERSCMVDRSWEQREAGEQIEVGSREKLGSRQKLVAKKSWGVPILMLGAERSWRVDRSWKQREANRQNLGAERSEQIELGSREKRVDRTWEQKEAVEYLEVRSRVKLGNQPGFSRGFKKKQKNRRRSKIYNQRVSGALEKAESPTFRCKSAKVP